MNALFPLFFLCSTCCLLVHPYVSTIYFSGSYPGLLSIFASRTVTNKGTLEIANYREPLHNRAATRGRLKRQKWTATRATKQAEVTDEVNNRQELQRKPENLASKHDLNLIHIMNSPFNRDSLHIYSVLPNRTLQGLRLSNLMSSLLYFHHLTNQTVVPMDFIHGESAIQVEKQPVHNSVAIQIPKGVSSHKLGPSLRRFSLKYPDLQFLLNGDPNQSFQLDSSSNYRRYDFESFIQAICVYKALHNGSLVMPRNFIVPAAAPWPPESWHMRLTKKITDTRSGRIYTKAAQVQRLNQIGFEWKPSAARREEFMRAVNAYYVKYGNLQMPIHFVVPSNSVDFPRETWGMKLGFKVNNYRYRGDYGEFREKLKLMGLSDEYCGYDQRHWEHILAGLKVYKQMFGDLQMATNFSVPLHSQRWPQSLWGLKLGYRVHNIQYRGDFILENATCARQLQQLGGLEIRCPAYWSKIHSSDNDDDFSSDDYSDADE